MKLIDVTTEEGVIRYIEGCINDFEYGISTNDETCKHINDLIIYLIKLDRTNHGYKLANGESKLPIA